MDNRLPLPSFRTVTLRGDGLPEILGQVALTVARVQGTVDLNELFSYTVEFKTPDERWGLGGPAANLDLPALRGMRQRFADDLKSRIAS
ncbi:hypothetical protein ACIP1U_25200 [Cupriavidus sp. NPDC089707]|uniref:hypothetical protein n=1 Tax=Cupriavidus sp. NPDC089707 TaxID=3363963 RepID=UPI00381515E4